MILTAELSGSDSGSGNNTAACSTAFMSVALNNSDAFDANSLRVTGNVPVRASITVLITDLTPGVAINFAARYKNVTLGSAVRHREVQCETNHRDPELAVTTARRVMNEVIDQEVRTRLLDIVLGRSSWEPSELCDVIAEHEYSRLPQSQKRVREQCLEGLQSV